MFENPLQTQMSRLAEFGPNNAITTGQTFPKTSKNLTNSREDGISNVAVCRQLAAGGDFHIFSRERESEKEISEECLQINYNFLKSEMESRGVLDHLHSVDLFSDEFLETCRETEKRRRRNDLIIKEVFKIAKHKSRSVLQHFVKALRMTGQEHIVNHLLAQKCPQELENQKPKVPIDFLISMRHRIIEDVEPREIIDNLLVTKAISFLDHEDVEQIQYRKDRVKFILQKADQSENCSAEITTAIKDTYPKLFEENEQRAENTDAMNQQVSVSIRMNLQSLDERESVQQGLKQIESDAVNNFYSREPSSYTFTNDLEECLCKLERLEISSIVIHLRAENRESLQKMLNKIKSGRAIDWLYSMLNETDKQSLTRMRANKLLVTVRVNEEENTVHLQPPEGCLCRLNKDTIIKNKDILLENLTSTDIEVLAGHMKSHGLNGPNLMKGESTFLDFLIDENNPRISFCIFEEYLKIKKPSLLYSLLTDCEPQDTVVLNPNIKEHEKFLAEELEVHAYLSVIQAWKNEKSTNFLKKIKECQRRSSRVEEFLNFIICEKDPTWFWEEVRKKQKYIWDYILSSTKNDDQLNRDLLAAKLMSDEIVEEIDPLCLKKYMKACTIEQFRFVDIEKIQCRKLQAQFLMNRLTMETIDEFIDALSKSGYNRIRNQIKAGSLAEKYTCPRIHDKKNIFESEFDISPAHFGLFQGMKEECFRRFRGRMYDEYLDESFADEGIKEERSRRFRTTMYEESSDESSSDESFLDEFLSDEANTDLENYKTTIEQKLQELKTSHETKNSDAISENPGKVIFEWNPEQVEELKSIELNLERIMNKQELRRARKGLISESSDGIFESQKLYYLGRLLELKEIELDVKRIKDKQDLQRAKKEYHKSGSSYKNLEILKMRLSGQKIKLDGMKEERSRSFISTMYDESLDESSSNEPFSDVSLSDEEIERDLKRIKDKQDLQRTKKESPKSESRCEFPRFLEMLSVERYFRLKEIEQDLKRIKEKQDLRRAKNEGPKSVSRCEIPEILELQSLECNIELNAIEEQLMMLPRFFSRSRSSDEMFKRQWLQFYELKAIELEWKRQNDKEEQQRAWKGLVSQRSDAMSESQWLKPLERFYELKAIELTLKRQMDKQKVQRARKGFRAKSSDVMSESELMQTLLRLFESNKRDLKRLNKKQERQWMQALGRFLELKEIDLTLTRIECEKILQREGICYKSDNSDAMSKEIEPKIYTARDNESLQRARESYLSKFKDTVLEFERKLKEHNAQLQMDIGNLQSERIRDTEPNIYTARDKESLQRARESYRSKFEDTFSEFERNLMELEAQLQMDIDNLQSERIRASDIEPKIYTARDKESLQREMESHRSKIIDTVLEFEMNLMEFDAQLQMDIDNLQSESIRIYEKKKMEYEKKMEYDQKLPLALEKPISDCSGGILELKCGEIYEGVSKSLKRQSETSSCAIL